jgi:transcriptional regulator with XRE-family HTH domain
MTREEILKHPAYWFEHEQNELYRQVISYMEREEINQTELAERLKVSKGYISQILNGKFNYTLKKLIEISLAIGVVPRIKYDDISELMRDDKKAGTAKKSSRVKTLMDEITKLSPSEKEELNDLLWPIPEEHKILVLDRITEAKANPDLLLNVDVAFKTLNRKKKFDAEKFNGA